MGKHDGVFRKESFDEHYITLLKEMGIMDGRMDAMEKEDVWTEKMDGCV